MRYYNQRGKGRPNVSRPGQNRKDHIPKGCQCTKSTHCPGDPAKRICIACQCYLRGEGPLNPNNFSGFSRFAGQETGGGEVMSVQDFINDIP